MKAVYGHKFIEIASLLLMGVALHQRSLLLSVLVLIGTRLVTPSHEESGAIPMAGSVALGLLLRSVSHVELLADGVPVVFVIMLACATYSSQKLMTAALYAGSSVAFLVPTADIAVLRSEWLFSFAYLYAGVALSTLAGAVRSRSRVSGWLLDLGGPLLVYFVGHLIGRLFVLPAIAFSQMSAHWVTVLLVPGMIASGVIAGMRGMSSAWRARAEKQEVANERGDAGP